MLLISNMATTNVIVYVIAAILGAKEVWRFLVEKNKSNEKIELRKLDIEAKGREFAKAAFDEFKSKQDAAFEELKNSYREVLMELNTTKNLLHEAQIDLTKATDALNRIEGYMTSMYNIAKHNLQDESVLQIVDDLHSQARQTIKK